MKKFSLKPLKIHPPLSEWILKKRQYGFTLVEMMVVMAIIAILSTMGVVGYTGFIKGARDAQRMADIAHLDAIILDFRRSTGQYPTTKAAFDSVVQNANQNQPLQDALVGKVACITSQTDTSLTYCEYVFYACDNGDGYLLSGKFETMANAKKYTTVSGGEVSTGYNVGLCTQIDAPPLPPPAPPPPAPPQKIPDGGLCDNKDECLDNRVCVGPPPKHCRPKNNQTKDAYCTFDVDCLSENCNTQSNRCKK